MQTITTTDRTITFDDSPEAKDRVFDLMLDFFKQVDMFSGECLGQSDETYIEAPNILSEVAEDGFKFKVEYSDDLSDQTDYKNSLKNDC